MKNSLLMKFFSGLIFGVLFFASSGNVQALGDPVKISNSSNAAVGPEIVSDSNGYMHTVYMEVESEDTIWGNHANSGIYYSRWNGDVWSSPLKISENTGFAEVPSIAADSNNTIYTVWDDATYGGVDANNNELYKIAYKTRSAAGVWSAIESLPKATGTGNNLWGRVAIGQSNVPNVVYSGVNETFTSISYYWTQKVAGNWTSPTAISFDESNNLLTSCTWADIKNDSAGNLHLIYFCWGSGGNPGGVYYRKYSSGSWSTPIAVSTAGDIQFARLAVTPTGEAFASWFQSIDKSIRVRWTVAGVWQNEQTLTNSGDSSIWGYPILGVTTDSKERAHVGWGERDAGDLIDVRFKTFVPGSGWGAVQDVDLDNNDADTPFIFPDKWDNQHFVWMEKNPSTSQWEIYYRVAEGTIQTVQTTGATITANPFNITYATLEIPSGALSSATQIGIQIGPVPESVGTTQVTIPRSFTFRPNGLVFNTASTAVVFYNDAELGGADERLLKPWFWNSQTSAWEARSGTVQRAQNKITVSLNGFSLYGISAPLFSESTWIKPSENENVKQASMLIEFQQPFTYKDGSDIIPAETPEDELKLVIKDSSGNIIRTLREKTGELSKDEGKGRFKAVLNFQKDGYQNGVYTLEVYLIDTLVGSQSFTLERK